MIKAHNLTKSYGGRRVLRGCSLTVEPGEIVVLIGVNGAGKTTLLRILANLTHPEIGSIHLDGITPRSDPARYRKSIGAVLHAPMLYGNLTGRENLRFFSRIYQLRQPETRTNQVLEMVNLTSRADDLVRAYSRGMLQRLSIARALLHDPTCLLLDEPHTGLDQESASVLDSLLVQAAEQGKMVLLVTHDLETACRLSSRVDLLHQGKVAHSTASAGLTPASLEALYHEVTGVAPAKQTQGEST